MTKVVVITGSSRGIGAATALAFGQAGYDVVINYRDDQKNADDVVNQIKDMGQNAVAFKANAFSEEGIQKLFEGVYTFSPKIDVLVNNAADPHEPDFGEYTCDSINRSLGANFGSAVLCTQEAVKYMDQGCILFTSSIYGLPFGGNSGLALYSAAKAAIINFTQTMAEGLAPNIRCNVVVPGTTRTPHWKNVAPEYAQKSLDMTLQKEWVEPEEIANGFLFLAETPHITGQIITIDAGWQKKIRDNSPKRK